MTDRREQFVGYLAFLFHAHLPFVPGCSKETTLEEKWLMEAVTESYLPLFLSWEKLLDEGVDFKLTLSLSPTLLAMITDRQFPERYLHYLTNLQTLAEKELERTSRYDPSFFSQATFYHNRLFMLREAFQNKYQGCLIGPIKRLWECGRLELITTCATHGFLPLLLTDQSRRAQVRTGLRSFEETFGFVPKGLWLPECAYTPGLEKILAQEGLNYFLISAHGFLNAVPQVNSAVYAPVKLPCGVAVFGRDWETSHQVWSRTEGYPGDPAYREFYRDIGYDLDEDYVRPFLTGGVRGDTGLKYYRITGNGDNKEPYERAAAMARIREHARNFIGNRNRQVEHWAGKGIEGPIIAAPYDAELFGHWWFEGPEWLEEVLRLTAEKSQNVRTITYSEYLTKYPPAQEVVLGPSTWGDGGYNRFWLNPGNDWCYPLLHRAEKTMINLAESLASSDPLRERLLRQASRELMLAQSSDWPFILTSNTMTDYARRRIEDHVSNFFKLAEAYRDGVADPEFLTGLETENHLFPNVDFWDYRSETPLFPESMQNDPGRPLVLMLSWEYPPNHVGGLGIHVRCLSEELVGMGFGVHVLTFAQGGEWHTSAINGVWVHFIPTLQRAGCDTDFLTWVLQLNLAMADVGSEWIERNAGRQIILHAHDWLVAYAALELQTAFDLPLVSTIHATEHGRNRGLHNHVQASINALEQDLVSASSRIVCCSKYMEHEVSQLFQPDPGDVRMIPNAVNPPVVGAVQVREPFILFIGRLVVEKGVQDLLAAFAMIRDRYPSLRVKIAGAGPYKDELLEITRRLTIADRVDFLGFLSERARDRMLARCQMAVFPSLYEPFGIVALEAMAAGIPVVVSQTGGLAEIVEDGRSGLCFEPGNVADLSQCLVNLLQNPGKAAEFTVNARRRIKREYSWVAVAEQTKHVYDEVLDGGGKGPSPGFVKKREVNASVSGCGSRSKRKLNPVDIENAG